MTSTIPISEARKLVKAPNKYRAERTTIDGITFASRREARRYQWLKIAERCGAISDLVLQPSFRIEIAAVLVCRVVADFGYTMDGQAVIEDCKGVRTPIYRLKKKLLRATHGIEIKET